VKKICWGGGGAAGRCNESDKRNAWGVRYSGK